MSPSTMTRIPEPLRLGNQPSSTPRHIIPATAVGSVLSRSNNLPHTNVWAELERQQRLRIEDSHAVSDITQEEFASLASNLGPVVVREASFRRGQVITMIAVGCTVASLSYFTDGTFGSGIHDLIGSRVIDNIGFVREPEFISESLVQARSAPSGLQILSYDAATTSTGLEIVHDTNPASTTTSSGLEIAPYNESLQASTSDQASTSAQPSTTNTATTSIARSGGAIMLSLMLAWVALGNGGVIDTGVASSLSEIFDH